MLGVTATKLSIPFRGLAILLVVPFYRNQDVLYQLELVDSRKRVWDYFFDSFQHHEMVRFRILPKPDFPIIDVGFMFFFSFL